MKVYHGECSHTVSGEIKQRKCRLIERLSRHERLPNSVHVLCEYNIYIIMYNIYNIVNDGRVI